ncbi:bifunctional UDP-N-acetylglucosamine diphosphorylase/glucosamine-1-phosphate N-acetyltransferase GlmU [Desulfonauticus submarinus]
MKTIVLVLAAGKGTRMAASCPKVMQKILDRPMLWYVLRALEKNFKGHIYPIIGYKKEEIEQYFPLYQEYFIYQKEQLGTGHALQSAWDIIKRLNPKYVLVTNGDTPLALPLHFHRLEKTIEEQGASVVFLSLELDDPGSYGRVLRDKKGNILKIIEAKDSSQDLTSREVNAGIYCFKREFLEEYLFKLQNKNAQQEYYITDLIEIAIKNNLKVCALNMGYCPELMGINTPVELEQQEEVLRKRIVYSCLERGVCIHFSRMVIIGPEVDIEKGVEIEGPCTILGKTKLRKGSVIKSYTFIKDCDIDGIVYEFSHIVGSVIKRGAQVGPYARLRPGAIVESKARVGNFVEMKKSVLGKESKACHLTYLGDANIGPNVNIGAGTITCNYDGKNKHQTIIKEGAFIGSNSALVAPVQIGKHALIGAGSTITKDVPDNKLAIARSKQVVLKKRGK